MDVIFKKTEHYFVFMCVEGWLGLGLDLIDVVWSLLAYLTDNRTVPYYVSVAAASDQIRASPALPTSFLYNIHTSPNQPAQTTSLDLAVPRPAALFQNCCMKLPFCIYVPKTYILTL